MLRSLYSGISGLKNHQIKMDVVGNNIANVNTTGFKRSSVTFATMLSQNLRGASTPTTNQGGTNAQQIGLGVKLGAINQIMTQGSAQSTGTTTDLMLQGPGFFVMDNAGQKVYTRAGGFSKDTNDYLEDPGTGAKVQGFSWGKDDSTAPKWGAADVGSIKFSIGDKYLGDAGLPLTLSSAPEAFGSFSATTPSTIVDANLIGAGDVSIAGFTKVTLGQANLGTSEFTFDSTTGTITLASAPTADLNVEHVPAFPLPVVNSNGSFTVPYPPTQGATIYVGPTGTPTAYTLGADPANLGATEYSVSTVNGGYQINFASAATFTAASTTAPVETDTIGYDFTNAPHTLNSFSIDQNGVITGVYGNGVDSVSHKIAQIAVAKFTNDTGLANLGGSFYSTTPNSGEPSIGAASQDGRAAIIPSTVEMSNVDLAQEFTDMIVTQRGFQANSKVITTSDALLQEIIDMKR